MKITVDFTKGIGKIKPVCGITNGPIYSNGTRDMSCHYKEIGFPHVRLHDTDNNDSRCHVDISRIFENFSADENDPASYQFEHTDQLLNAIDACGSKIIYRLGESIDHSIKKRYIKVPDDMNKWSRICVNIIRHYNEGWANGFRLGIKYWEIWNEPDCLNADGTNPMWLGTKEQAFELYQIASKTIKEYNSELFIGGMAFTSYNDYAHDFLDYCVANKLPLDFISYHCYSDIPEHNSNHSISCREYLDSHGYNSAQIVIDEWNYVGLEHPYEGSIWAIARSVERAKEAREIYTSQKNEVGAAYVTASMISMNKEKVDIATYYDGQPRLSFCGLFDPYCIPQKTYYAFKAFCELYRESSEQAETIIDGTNLYAVAAKGDCADYILIANYRGSEGFAEIDMKGIAAGEKRAEVYMINKNSDFELSKTEIYHGDEVIQSIWLDKYSVAMIKIKH